MVTQLATCRAILRSTHLLLYSWACASSLPQPSLPAPLGILPALFSPLLAYCPKGPHHNPQVGYQTYLKVFDLVETPSFHPPDSHILSVPYQGFLEKEEVVGKGSLISNKSPLSRPLKTSLWQTALPSPLLSSNLGTRQFLFP